MYEQDYIMRQIHEIIRAILKLLFDIDTDAPSPVILTTSEEKQILAKLLEMVNDGKINEAEDMLYESIEYQNREDYKIALLFYSYLNDLSDDFLERCDFSREEVKQGLLDISEKFGAEGIAMLFLQ